IFKIEPGVSSGHAHGSCFFNDYDGEPPRGRRAEIMNRFFVRHLVAAALLLGGAILTWNAYGYSLEGPSWTAGTTITMYMELGSASPPLEDGNTSWDDAVIPAMDSWNAVMRDVQLSPVTNSSPPVEK